MWINYHLQKIRTLSNILTTKLYWIKFNFYMIQKNLESFSAPGTLPFHMLHKKILIISGFL